MCGIAGIINFNNNPVDELSISKMIRAMKHRGPDDEGMFFEHHVGLGFVRLSILDLSQSGHQPMVSENGRYIIVFNGEVYNYVELKEKLKEKYQFNSNTDTEVVLKSYIEWGESCLDKFNGMFAFAIYDTIEKTLFGARDRFGIKPFYYFYNYNQFIFASDIPPILTNQNVSAFPNNEVIFNYLLTNRTNYSEKTFFDNILKLNPGHKFKIENKKLTISQWYNIENHNITEGFNSSTEYDKVFIEAIKIQLRSDVPIGICLSGGLDSSSIAAVLLKAFKVNNLHAYSAIYNKGDVGDEQDFIHIFSNEKMNMHFVKPTAESFLNDIDEYVNALSEPVPGTSEYAEFKVMQLAKQYSTVILNGQGADEVLGGYDYFYSAYLKELILKFYFLQFLKECFYLKKHNKLLPTLKYLLFFLAPINIKRYILKKKNNIFKPKFYYNNKIYATQIIKQFYTFKSLKKFFKNHFKHKFEHHLLWADKSGMYFSLETRFPFIDHHLIEKTLSTSNSNILKNGWTKNILREAMINKLDDKIRLRKDKVGFETPEAEWIREPAFKNFINEIINSTSFNNRPYFDANKIKLLVNQHNAYKANHANLIWKTIHLELWLRKFIDKKEHQTPNNKTFVIITPVKNEAKFVKETLNSVINQTIKPNLWILVNDGSTDNTAQIINEYCLKFSWIKTINLENKNEERSGGSKVVNAFYNGLRTVNINNYNFIVKLDGDLILPKNYFETLLNEFENDKKLGICGGTIYNSYSEYDLRIEKVADFHVRGALKMIRKECWLQINGFKEVWNWDGLDIMEAQFYGWKTRSIDIPVIHLRPTTSAYNLVEHSYKSGYEAYKMGADCKLTLIRTIRKISTKPYFKISSAYFKGYLTAKKNKETIIVAESLAKFINNKHYSRFNLLKSIF